MKTVEIKNRWTDVILYATKVVDDDQCPIRTALEKAVDDNVNLIGANLSGAKLSLADLSNADLPNADLSSADLSSANLTRANLSGAYLCFANLSDAYLSFANLSGADLSNADLSDANLYRADLRGANLINANLVSADLSGVNLYGANIFDADFGVRYKDAPVVPRLDSQILERIESGQGKLDMDTWHTCETTHCRAGWAVVLAGDAGHKLEEKIGTAAAGALIYHRSTGRVPNFFANNEDALADIVACARCP
jgi:hypothetical protein